MKDVDWFVAYTYPNAEKKINSQLIMQNIDTYLPLQKVIRQWSRGKKQLEVPLFPNYIFVKVTPKQWSHVLSVPGIVRFVTSEKKPAVISEGEINTVKMLLSEQYEVCIDNEGLDIGNKVKVITGPLMGMEGVLVGKRGEKRFVVNLKSLDRVLSISIPIMYLAKVQDQLLDVVD